MLIAAFVLWLAVIALSAAAAVQLASGFLAHKTIDVMLLPGTLIARLGLIIGLLVSGGSLQNVPLIGEPRAGTSAGGSTKRWRATLTAIMAALVPIGACATSVVILVKWLGVSVARPVLTMAGSKHVPHDVASFWSFLRGGIDLMESALSGLADCNFADWRTWIFLYLLVCLSLRMSAARGNLRGLLGSLVLVGGGMAIGVWAYPALADLLNRGWPVVSLVVATNLLVLLATLITRGIVEIVRAFRGQPSTSRLRTA